MGGCGGAKAKIDFAFREKKFFWWGKNPLFPFSCFFDLQNTTKVNPITLPIADPHDGTISAQTSVYMKIFQVV